MLIKSFKARYPIAKLISSNDTFFDTIKSNYEKKKTSGLFQSADKNAIYILCVESGRGRHYGVVAHNDLQDFKKDKILVHEHTLEAKEQKMMEFIMDVNAMVKPVLLAHDKDPRISKWISRNIQFDPIMVFPMDNKDEIHYVWQVTDKEQIKKIVSLYQHVSHCYLADGHHRSSTMLKIFKNNLVGKKAKKKGILCAYFHFDQLAIYDYNRIVNLDSHMTAIEFVTKLSKYCKLKSLKKARKPSSAHQMTLFIEGEWLELTWRKKVVKVHSSEIPLLDAMLFNLYISSRIMNVMDIREDQSITYFEGTILPEEIEQKYDTIDNVAIFYLYPILQEDLKIVADEHRTLPPKTTWFEPRIKSGMIVSEL